MRLNFRKLLQYRFLNRKPKKQTPVLATFYDRPRYQLLAVVGGLPKTSPPLLHLRPSSDSLLVKEM
jgi:hypothetical protein